MSLSQKYPSPRETLVSPLFLQALEVLQDHEIGAISDSTAVSGPLLCDWRSGKTRQDLTLLSAAYRLSQILPESGEELAQFFFKPGSIVILEIPDGALIEACETALTEAFLTSVRRDFDYLPRPIVERVGQSNARSAWSRKKQQKAGGLPSSLISQTPTVLLVEDQRILPLSVRDAATNCLRLPVVSRQEINMLFRAIQRISFKAVLPKLLSGLPADDQLQKLPLDEVYAALRQPTSQKVSERIHSKIEAKAKSVVEGALDQVKGLGSSRPQLEQIAADMTAWKQGELDWQDVTQGVLLHGQPGTGKTFCAGKLAEQCGAHLVATSYSDWQRHGHMGDMLAAMRESFKEAREHAPSILFIDEIDAFGDREAVSGDNAQYSRAVITGLLEMLDGTARQEGVLVIGACNHPEFLDAALVRAGRFDLKISLPLPNKAGLIDLLKLHLGAEIPDTSLHSMATHLVGSTGADVAALVRQAKALARRNKHVFSIDDLRNAIKVSVPQVSETDLRLAALHEAGHAVVGYQTGRGRPVRAQISGQGGGVAFVASPPYPTIKYIEAQITTLMAGRASEELFLGAGSAGAGGSPESDLAQATTLAVSLESIFGLGATGLTWRPVTATTLAKFLAEPTFAKKIEARLQGALKQAKTVLREHRATVEAIAAALVEHRELSAGDLRQLLEAPHSSKTAPVDAESTAPSTMPVHG